MATDIYKMTPAERRARAERVKAQREQRYAYTNYLKAQREASAKQAQAIRRAEIEAQNERYSQNFLVRGAHTVGNVLGNVVEGAAKGIEGVIDLGAGVVGAAGGLISDDFRAGVKGFVEKDWVGDSFGDWLDESTKYSYTNDGYGGDIVESVSEGVGQILPAVALAVVTGGASAPESASSLAASFASGAASTAYIGVSAAGNATEQAYKDGAGYYEGLGYGLASGAVEAATERLSGGMGKVFGAGLLDDIGESVAKTGIRRVAKNAIGEAGEEVIAELANPALKTIYKGSDALKEYKDADYWKGVAEAGVVGGLTSMAYSGTVGYGLARRGIGYAGKDADVYASLEAIDNQRQTEAEYDAADKLTAENKTKISDNILANYKNIEKTLKSVSESKRADLISKFSLDKAFNSDGSMNADFSASLAAQSDFSKRYCSYNTRGKEAEILSDLTAITENEKRKNPNAETVTMFSGELPDTSKSNFAKLKKGLNYLNKRSERNISLVITNPSKTFNGLLLDGSKMYISADTLDSGDFAGTVVHEYMHVAEGSEQYDKLMSFLKEDSALVENAKKSVIGKAYGISENTLNVIQQKIDNGIELSETETEVHNLYQSELGAHMVENLLGNENFIDRLVRADKGLAGNMLNKITELIGSFKAMGDATSRAEYKRLKHAEWMYLYAVEKAGYKYVNGRIEEDDEEDVEKNVAADYKNSINPFETKEENGKLYFDFENADVLDFFGIERLNDSVHIKKQVKKKLLETNFFEDSKKNKIVTNAQSKMPIEINIKSLEETFDMKERLGYNKKLLKLATIGSIDKFIEHANMIEDNVPDMHRNNPHIKFAYFETEFYSNGELHRLLIGVKKTPDKNKFYVHQIDVDYKKSTTPLTSERDIKNISASAFSSSAEESKPQKRSDVNTNSTQKSSNNSTKIQSSLKDRNYTPSEKADYYAERAAEKTDDDLHSLLDDVDKTNVAAQETLYNKRYTKKDAESVLDSIMSDFFVSDEYSVRLKGKGTIVDRIYRVLNDSKSGERAGVVNELADIIVQNAVAENILAYDIDFESVNNRLSILKFWKNGMDLSEIRSDIKNKYDDDNSVFLRWSSKQGGMRPEEVARELAEDYGIHIKSEHPADIFFEIDDMYMRDLQQIQQKTKFSIDETIGREDYKTLRQQISKELLRSFDNYGKDTKIQSVQKDFKAYKKEQAKNVKEIIDKLNLKARIIYRLYRAVETKYGKYAHASQAENESLKVIRDALPKILVNGNINKTSTRKILSELSKWYSDKNEMLAGFYDQGIRDSIEYFMTVEEVEGELSLAELKELDKILKHFNYIFANHNRVYRNGRYVDAIKIAENDVENAKKAKEMHSKNGWMRFAKSKAIRFFSDPLSVFRQLDGYNPNGFFTTAFTEFRDGIINSGMAKMDINRDYDAFYAEKGNKRYIKDLMNDKYTVKIGDYEIPKAVAMGLYMTSKTGNALDTLTESGWYMQKKVKGKEGNGVTKVPMPTVTPSMLADLYAQFDKRDIRLMEIMDKAYKKCGEYKAQTDNIKYGFTNVMEGTYYPLKRIHADNVDSDDMAAEMDRVSNASFNKSRVEHAKNGFIIENALNVFTRHTAAVSNYYGLSIPVENFNRLWNLDTSGSDVGARMPISVKTVYDSFDGGAGKYVRDLIEDVQGLSSRKDMGNTIVSFIRGNYAKYQLGANPKVWLTQGSSYVAALGKLDVQSLSKGFGIKVSAEDVEKYCDVAALRKYDGGVAKAMSVTETTGNALMKTIGDVDNLIVRRLFGACQVEAKRRYNLEIGTEENKVKAGELLREVILDTQQSAMATEWSAAMRSPSEIIKSFTMFGADSMKACSRFIDAVGEFTALRTQLKDAKGAEKVDADEVQRLEKKMKSAAKNIGRQSASICSIAVYMTAISELMRFLLNKKDDEDESFAKRVTSETVGNIVGMVPIVRDLWSFFGEGYDVDNYAYSAVNDMLTAIKDMFDVLSGAASGEVTTAQDTAKMLRKLFYAAGQLSGLPTRNAYNYVTGIIRRVDESTAYKIDSLFYKASYKSDLAKAIEEGDDRLAETIMNMMLAGNGEYSSGTAAVMKDLYSKGYDCLPKSVKDTVTVDGVEYVLSNKQYESFKDIYGDANKKVDAVVSSRAFASADDKSKAKMIKFVYDAYYDIARADVVDVDTSSRNALFSEAIDISVLAQVVAQVQSITADTDRKGKTISGSKKKKVQLLVNSLRLTAVQKYMIMGYLGYTNKNGAQAVKSYINRLSLSSAEKDLLYKYSGYAALYSVKQ